MESSITLAKARAAKPAANEVFSHLAEVVGVGITTIGTDYGLKINLRSNPAPGTPLPTEVNGVPVKIEIVGAIRKRKA
jgi:hypothetical protein